MSKRLSLREFQQSVIARLQAGSQAGQRASTLGVQVGAENWLVEMSDISEVLPVPSATAVPLTKRWFWGVSNVRGNLYSLVDIGDFLEVGETPHDGASRVLLISPRYGFSTGLVVSRVLGLRNAHEWKAEGQEGQLRYTDEQGQVWRKLDVPTLLKQPNFLQIEM